MKRARGFTLIGLPGVRPFDRLRPGKRKRGAFTLIELLVVIALIALLVSILVPSLQRAKEMAYSVGCRAHLRQLMNAENTYAMLHDGSLPGPLGVGDIRLGGTGQWINTPVTTGRHWKAGTVMDPGIWLCPRDVRQPGTFTFSFTYNGRTMIPPEQDGQHHVWLMNHGDDYLISRKVESFARPYRTILLAEENTGMIEGFRINDPFFIGVDWTEPRHVGFALAGYLDAHVDEIPPYTQIHLDPNWWP